MTLHGAKYELGQAATRAKNLARSLCRGAGFDIVSVMSPPRAAPAPDDAVFAELQKKYPFPEISASIRPLEWSLDFGGRELIADHIRQHSVRSMVEIGSFLGGSALRWLACAPELRIVCVDPWTEREEWSAGDYAAEKGRGDFREQLDQPAGFFHTFLRNVSAQKERIIPVRGRSPEALLPLFLAGFTPQLVYIDAAKSFDDIAVSHALWPQAALSGDDWMWLPAENFPARQAVLRFAALHDMQVFFRESTWVLVPPVR